MAGRLEGRRIAFLTANEGVEQVELTDLVRAGARWPDEPLVVDGNFVSSRRPDDLRTFCGALVDSGASAAPLAGQ